MIGEGCVHSVLDLPVLSFILLYFFFPWNSVSVAGNVSPLFVCLLLSVNRYRSSTDNYSRTALYSVVSEPRVKNSMRIAWKKYGELLEALSSATLLLRSIL